MFTIINVSLFTKNIFYAILAVTVFTLQGRYDVSFFVCLTATGGRSGRPFCLLYYNQHVFLTAVGSRGVPRIFGEGGGPRSAKEANKPNKRATELKPRTCAHHGVNI